MSKRATRDRPVPDRMPVHNGRVLGRPDRFVWPVLAVALVIGALAYALLSDRPARATASYVIAMLVVVACLATVTLNVRMATRISPATTLLAAIFSYGFTVAVMSLGWLLSSPRVVVGPAVFAGIVVAVVVWTTGVARASWVR